MRPPLEMSLAMSFNYFNPRTPGGVRRKYISFALILYPISIHAPRVGCDGIISAQVPSVANFNPRTPGGVRPIYANGIIYDLIFQSTHPGWGATRDTIPTRKPSAISIHAPRVGCDFCNSGNKIQQKCISIHAPRVGCDSYESRLCIR